MSDFSSERQSLARRAYGDKEKSALLHGKDVEIFNVELRKHGAIRNRSFVLSAMLGLSTASVVVAACAGSPRLRDGVFRVAGLGTAVCTAVIGGLQLALVTTSCLHHERVVYDIELRREQWEIDNDYNGEIKEMLAIYKNQGLSDQEASTVTRILAKDKQAFAQLMMVEELGYSRLDPPTLWESVEHAAAPAAAGFALGVVSPLLPLMGLWHRLLPISRALLSNRATGAGRVTALAETADGSAAVPLMLALSSTAIAAATTGLTLLEMRVFYGEYSDAVGIRRLLTYNLGRVALLGALTYATACFM